MALTDLTDPAAVRRAIGEFDQIGRSAFLNKYGFRQSVSYFLELEGHRYDSKAVVGAAHGYQHGTPLRADEFSGGEATVATLLTSLGFVVIRPAADWTTPIGFVGTRTEIKAMYGGSIYGGIEASRTSPNILIYTDPDRGALNGYNYDGWDADELTFFYTGEGRTGDQEIRVGNKAILEHVETGRTIRLFEAVKEKQQHGGKRHRYVGAFRVDSRAPYRREPAPDAAGNPRRVIVFRLLRDEVVGGAIAIDVTDTLTTPGSAHVRPTSVSLIPSEINIVLEYETAPSTGSAAVRDEAKLVQEFEAWLREQGHDLKRWRISIAGEPHALVTDTYDETAHVLYEAKSSADRATIRLGIGQLMDYLRFLPNVRGSLLLPREPSSDLKEFVASCGFGLTYPAVGQWVVNEPLKFPQGI